MKLEHKQISLADASFKAKSDAQGVFSGWASKFGGLDSYNDTILPGAYKDTLASGRKVAMYFNHISRRSDMAANIGKWTLEEKAEGLWVEGTLTLEHPLVKNLVPSLTAGDLDGLSIGYSIPEGGAVMLPNGVRQISKIDLYEVSVVESPADDAARIENMKSFDGCYTVRDLESRLREEGLSQAKAKAAVAAAKGIFAQTPEAKTELPTPEAEALAALARIFGKK